MLCVSFAVLLSVGYAGLWPHQDVNAALRWALAAMFVFTASAHFVPSLRADLVRMVPPQLPRAEALVTLTGVLEIVGAVGLTLPRFAPLAAGGLFLLLLAMFPANISAALRGLTLHGRPVTALVPRTLLQLVFLVAVLLAGLGWP